MLFKSKIKWAALGGLVLSFLSLLVHLLLAKYSSADLVQYSAFKGFIEDLNLNVGGRQVKLDIYFAAYYMVVMIHFHVEFLLLMLECFFFLSSNCYRALDIEKCGGM